MIYITEEKLKELLAGAPEHLRPVPPRRMVAFDVETPNSRGDRICSAGLTVIENNRVVESMEIRVNPETEFDWRCIKVHGIRPSDVEDEPVFSGLRAGLDDSDLHDDPSSGLICSKP